MTAMYKKGEIDRIGQILSCSLPDSVLREASKPDSPLWQRRRPYQFTFMSAQDHIEYQGYLKDPVIFPIVHIPEARVLWMDDESNYMAVFVSGPMEGRVFLVGHDTNIDCAPLYRSAHRFASALRAGTKSMKADWPWQVDYPNFGNEIVSPPTALQRKTDSQCVRQLDEQVSLDPSIVRKRFLFSCIVALTPRSQASKLMQLLDDPDYHICGRACAMLGYHRFERACPRLTAIAMETGNFARFRAVDGLGLIRSRASLQALRKLVRSGEYLPGNITSALEAHSCETRVDEGKVIKWYVRFPDENRWDLVKLDNQLRPLYWWRFGLEPRTVKKLGREPATSISICPAAASGRRDPSRLPPGNREAVIDRPTPENGDETV